MKPIFVFNFSPGRIRGPQEIQSGKTSAEETKGQKAEENGDQEKENEEEDIVIVGVQQYGKRLISADVKELSAFLSEKPVRGTITTASNRKSSANKNSSSSRVSESVRRISIKDELNTAVLKNHNRVGSAVSRKSSARNSAKRSPSILTNSARKRRPISGRKKTPKPRCAGQGCKKKINITNGFSCRCTRIFCAKHRHPESHECTYDYKAEGRKLLEKENPLITLPKLPKI